MTRIGIATITALMALSAPAMAQSAKPNGGSPVLSHEETQRELLGIEMSGETSNDRSRWSECIAPGGDTVYRIDGEELLGRIRFQDDGEVCFTYKYDEYTRQNCFKVTRTEKGYSFWGGQDGVFHATSVRHGLQTCPNSQTPLF